MSHHYFSNLVQQAGTVRRRLKPIAFVIGCAGMLLALLLIAVETQQFERQATTISSVLVVVLAPVFLYATVILLALCAVIFMSPWGRIRIGGEGAEPIYTPFQWFSVSLTTVIAMGILFWAVAEPVVHFREPPPLWETALDEQGRARAALATALTHWTLAPYAIYTVTGLAFALGFHNRGYSFSVDALLRPLLGSRLGERRAQVVDGLVLFALIAGMAAVLSVGLLLIGDGLGLLFGAVSTPWLHAAVALTVMCASLYSAHRGLQRGIGVWARANVILFIGLALYVLIAGPSAWIIQLGRESVGSYFSEFVPRHLAIGQPDDTYWSARWTIVLLASWFAWAPLVCLFLGRIARGYTLRQFILVNLILPSLFGLAWFAIFGASALYFDARDGGALYNAYQNGGLGRMTYLLFGYLPGGVGLSLVFVLACLVSFITAADSNMEAIGGLCTRNVTAKSARSPFAVKVFWAAVIGFAAWYSLVFLGGDGIRLLAGLAGFPAVIIVLGSGVSLLLMLVRDYSKSKGSSS